MSGQSAEAMSLAWRDWRHEFLLSLCAVLALASMLAPLLILQGLKNGVINGMRERILQDPAALIITPKSDAGRFTPEFIAGLRQLPDAAYAIGRTRATASDLTFSNEAQKLRASIALEPSTQGEPVLTSHGLAAPEDGSEPEIVLSATAAAALKVHAREKLQANLSRRTPDGHLESVPMNFTVSAILPKIVADRKMAFVPLQVLEAMEKYRDNIAVPERDLAGAMPPGPTIYASFRLYAKDLDAVAPLAAILEKQKIEVITKGRDIAAMKALEQAINQIILIISLAVGLGFVAFTFSSSESAARRKRRMLGMLRLLGMQRAALVYYPLTQCLLTAIGGFVMAMVIYLMVAAAIASAFAAKGGVVCDLRPQDALLAFAVVVLLSALATVRSAWQTASLEPSLVIRDI